MEHPHTNVPCITAHVPLLSEECSCIRKIRGCSGRFFLGRHTHFLCCIHRRLVPSKKQAAQACQHITLHPEHTAADCQQHDKATALCRCRNAVPRQPRSVSGMGSNPSLHPLHPSGVPSLQPCAGSQADAHAVQPDQKQEIIKNEDV